jgi:hypothetical protein
VDNITPASAVSPLSKKYKYESRPQVLISPMRASALDPNFFKRRNTRQIVGEDGLLVESPPKPVKVVPRKNLTELLDIADDSSSEDSLVQAIESAKKVPVTVSESGKESLYDEALHDLNDAWESDLIVDVADESQEIQNVGRVIEEEEEEVDELEDSLASVALPLDEIIVPPTKVDERAKEAPQAKDAIRDLFTDLF